jgi:hypothetical protein
MRGLNKMKFRNKNNSDELVYVSKNAMQKLLTIAKHMEDYEFRCISVAEPGTNIISDFYIPPNQDIGKSNVRVEAHDYFSCSAEIREVGKRPVGMTHGHGNHGVFHSSTDHDSLKKILSAYKRNQVSENSFKYEFQRSDYNPRLQKLFVNDQITFEMFLPDVEWFEKGEIVVPQSTQYSVSSIVINQEAMVYAIKRFEEKHFFIPSYKGYLDHLQRAQAEFPKEFEHDEVNNVIRYSSDAIVVVSTDETIDQKELQSEDSILKELKEKMVFKGNDRPSAFSIKARTTPNLGLASLFTKKGTNTPYGNVNNLGVYETYSSDFDTPELHEKASDDELEMQSIFFSELNENIENILNSSESIVIHKKEPKRRIIID